MNQIVKSSFLCSIGDPYTCLERFWVVYNKKKREAYNAN